MPASLRYPLLSKAKSKVVIQIQNPLPGGSSYTSPRRAGDFIASGRAIPVGPYLIRFVSKSEQRRQIEAEQKLAVSRRRQEWVGMGLNPDDPEAGTIATLDQIQGLPMAGPAQRIVREGSAHFKPRALSRGPVRVLCMGSA